MRPNRLTLTAFGAFPDQVEVDFGTLGGDGLLLLCGETGGGKTTLLDAIGFALFGRVPGMRGQIPASRDLHLRSHHAAPDARPEVTLDFTVAAGRFRITRSPAWDRPKRGGGVTRAHPSARLERLDGAVWEAIAERNDDVGHEVDLLLGMNAEQFFQVILLPQGRFADFLHAEHAEREKLLKRLFHVSRFEHAEQWLADQAKLAANQVAVRETDLARLAARIAQQAGVDEPDPTAAGPAWAGELAAAAEATAATEAAAEQAALTFRDDAEHTLAATLDLARRVERRRALLTRQAVLAAEAETVSALADEVAAARRAATVSRALAEVLTRTTEAEAARATDRAARDRLNRHAPDLLTADPRATDSLSPDPRAPGAHTADLPAAADPVTSDPVTSDPVASDPVASGDTGATGAPELSFGELPADQLAERARQARTDLGRLERYADALAAADADLDIERQAQAEVRRHATEAAQAAEELRTSLPAARARAQARVDEAQQASGGLTALRERARVAKDLAAARRAQRTARRQADESARAAAEAGTRADDLRRQRFDAITAELAAALVDDTPCPVCGALDHPDPTEIRADHVSKDDETSARQEADRLAAEATDATREADQWDGQVRSLHTSLTAETPTTTATVGDTAGHIDGGADADGDDGDGEDGRMLAALLAEIRATDPAALSGAVEEVAFDEHLDRVDRVARLLTAAVGRRAALAATLSAAQADLRTALDDEKTTATRHAAAVSAGSAEDVRAREARDRATRALQDIPAALRDATLLAQHREAVLALAADLEAAHDAALDADRATREHIRSAQAALDASRDAGFDDLDDAAAAVREPRWIEKNDARVRQHHEDLLTVTSQLAGEDLAVDVDATLPLADHQQAADTARDAYQAAVAAAARATARAEGLRDIVASYADDHAALAPVRDKADELRGLADLTAGRGANTEGMPLSSFVLAARLEEVAVAASARLSAMSASRFTLVYDDGERRDKRRRAGLGLLVEDAWTGHRRDTGTLSGGETFQAALSLALGLADVVTAEAGGQRMDALFIDEGFGTLDPDSLDEVMTVLDELRSGGRLVGVVSHVTELRQRIPNQIRVLKGIHGSHLETTP